MQTKRICLLAAICAAMLFLPAMASAGGPNYITIRGGAGWAMDVDRTAGPYTATIEYETPWSLGAAYGRRVLPWLRLEGEFSLVELKVDKITGNRGQDTNASGRDRFYNFMINGIADFKNSTAFTPFVGAGAGAVYAHHDVSFSPVAGRPAYESDHHQWVFGYQLMAGVGWEFVPGMSLDLMYRFLGIQDRDHDQSNSRNYDQINVDASQIHLILLGLRIAF
jgi:OOP family OmpA-OmpF porin